MILESAQNPRFKSYLELLEARGIKKQKRALVAGPKLVREFLEQRPDRVVEVLRTPKNATPFEPACTLAPKLFDQLDVFGTRAPLLVVEAEPPPAWTLAPPNGLELVVALSDPGNLGTLLRSAEAFGVARVILCRETCSPFLPKALRAASGATFRLPLTTTGSLRELEDTHLVALDLKGQNLAQFEWPRDVRLLLGEEGLGVPKHLSGDRLTIPIARTSESLNAAAAAAIALFAYRSTWPLG